MRLDGRVMGVTAALLALGAGSAAAITVPPAGGIASR
jgi:hypothetical protein